MHGIIVFNCWILRPLIFSRWIFIFCSIQCRGHPLVHFHSRVQYIRKHWPLNVSSSNYCYVPDKTYFLLLGGLQFCGAWANVTFPACCKYTLFMKLRQVSVLSTKKVDCRRCVEFQSKSFCSYASLKKNVTSAQMRLKPLSIASVLECSFALITKFCLATIVIFLHNLLGPLQFVYHRYQISFTSNLWLSECFPTIFGHCVRHQFST